MSELQKQFLFARLTADLIVYAFQQGYQVTLGEAYRPPETAELYARQGKGISNSLHRRKLAIDLNLFKDSQYLKDTASYKVLGDYWKSLSGLGYECCWGGDFKGPLTDGNHFSLSHLGIK